jgi:IS30 family transposase
MATDMLMISDRPAEAADRTVPGHWEGDLIIGAFNRTAIGTLVERATRFVMLLHLPDGYAPGAVRDALVAKIATLPGGTRCGVRGYQERRVAMRSSSCSTEAMAVGGPPQ